MLICYDPHEYLLLRGLLSGIEQLPGGLPDYPVLKGSIGKAGVIVSRLPFGDRPELLRKTLQDLLDQTGPELVLSVGTAMAIEKGLRAGDILVTESAYAANEKRSCFNLAQSREFVSLGYDRRIMMTDSWTTDTFVEAGTCSDSTLTIPESAGHTTIIQMEDYHVADTLDSKGIPGISIRAVTDYGSMDDHLKNMPFVLQGMRILLERFFTRFSSVSGHVRSEFQPASKLNYNISLRNFHHALTLPESISLCNRIFTHFEFREWIPAGACVCIQSGDLCVPEAIDSKLVLYRKSAQHRHFNMYVQADRMKVLLYISSVAALDGIDQGWPINDSLEPVSPQITETDEHEPLDLHESGIGKLKKIYILGMNSVSAEACEGLMSSFTIAELKREGHEIVAPDKADVILCRTANIDSQSYFTVSYSFSSPLQHVDISDKTLVITGLGPALDAAAGGGDTADIILRGDEQGGRLTAILAHLNAISQSQELSFLFPGSAFLVKPGHATLNRLDLSFFVSDHTFEIFDLCQPDLRMIYSEKYDEFFNDYFQVPLLEKGNSLITFSSRGCGNSCSICCSGGHIPFQAIAPVKFISFLRNILDSGTFCNGNIINLFIVDSNFNKNPQRVIELSRLWKQESLSDFFRLYIRHNSVSPFLKRTSAGRVSVNFELLAAYKRLGIRELILGIDSYTDAGILMLKTDINKLSRHGKDSDPSYSFEDLLKVICAISDSGFRSRGYWLVGNPFISDEDRILEFYNLQEVCLKNPDFVIDQDSSEQVNLLKPFPGAPFTEISQDCNGAIIENSFVLTPFSRQIEEFVSRKIFNRRRNTADDLTIFISSCETSRFDLGVFLLHHLEEGLVEAVRSAEQFLLLESKIDGLTRDSLARFSLQKVQRDDLASLRTRLRSMLDKTSFSSVTPGPCDRDIQFYSRIKKYSHKNQSLR